MSTRRHTVLLLALSTLMWATSARADRLDQLARAVMSDPSFRVRLQAVLVMGKLADRRALPALVHALDDENDSVRATAAQALGKLARPGDLNVLSALRTAVQDPSRFVRERAGASLAMLEGGAAEPAGGARASRGGSSREVHVEVGGIGTKARNTPPELTRRLREFIVGELQRTPGLTIEGKPMSGFLIDSAITTLTRKTSGDYVEISCEVSFVVGRLPSKAMVMMTSGGATVQTPKVGFRPESERALQVDALKNAVEGAHQNLIAYLHSQH